MRYEDNSQAGGIAQGQGPIARDDADALTAGSRGPAVGNTITGEGTKFGAVGADVADGAHITKIEGAGGADSSFSGGRLQVAGEHGTISIDAQGNYRYMAKAGVPENSRDVFTYTLADAHGHAATANLTIEFGKTPAVVRADAQQIVPGPDGVVVLPEGVQLSDIMIVGRNLVINLPDGTQMVIVDGAVFVPQLVLGSVEVPPTNLAALLIDSEPQPAAGTPPPSSGGNFEVPVAPLDPGVPLGDLLPPTDMNYTPPEVHEVFPEVPDREPTIAIDPGNGVPVINAVDEVREAGLPTRNEGEPAGTGEAADGNGSNNSDPSEATGGTIVYDSPDGVQSITITGANGVPIVITAVGQVIVGQYGTMTITSIADGAIGYNYVLADNTSGDSTHDDFTVTITDPDGDQATATLAVNIVDDAPIAANDTDSIAAGQYGPATGNVITDASAGDAGDSDNGADNVGADNAHITAVSGAGGSDSSFNEDGNLVVNGQYGVLTLNGDGSYSYVRNPGTPGGVNDVFTYTLTDGDGDAATATLTISIADSPVTLDAPDSGEAGTSVSELGLPTRNGGEPAGTGEAADGDGTNNSDPSEATAGVINFNAPDGPATVSINGVDVTGVGQTFAGAYGTLTITGYDAATGQVGYSYVLADNTSGDATHDDFAIRVTDQDGDTANDTLVISIQDDAPTAVNDTDSIAAGQYGPATGNVITDAEGDGGADTVGADDAHVTSVVGAGGSDSTLDEGGNLVVNGQYGVLTLNADGSYSYVRNAGSPGGVSDVFTYTITDGDGDAASATLTISIADSPVTLDAPDQGEAGTSVSELGLPTRNGGEPAGTGEAADGDGTNNSDPSEATAGVINFNAPDGPATVSINGVAVTGVGQTFAGAYGTLTITSYNAATGQVGYSYVLADNTSGDATHDDFAIRVTDQDGDTANDTLVINIQDDAPIAVNDTDSLAAGEYGPATGNVITDAEGDGGMDNVGADDAHVTAVSGSGGSDNTPSGADGELTVNGTYGVLTINADGSYSYVRNAGTPGGVSDVFTYTITDGDGDAASATLTITIADNTPQLGTPATAQLDDDALAGGNPGGVGDDPNAVNVTGNLAGSGGDGPLTYHFGGANTLPAGFTTNLVDASHLQILQGGTVVLTITLDTATGAYSVVQNAPIDHAAGLDENNVLFGVGVYTQDVDGDTASASLSINVDDDTPLANNDSDTVPSGGSSASGNVISGVGTTEGAGNADHPGADGFGSISGLSGSGGSDTDPAGGFTVTGTYGSLQMDANGNYTYTRAAGTPGGVSESFTYTYVDGDGDAASAVLTINIADATPQLATPATAQLDDDALAGGNPGGVGDDPNAVNVTGNLAGSGGDGDLDYFFSGTNTLPAGFTTNLVNAGTLQVLQGGTVVLTITLNNETGAYSIVQNAPIDHAAGLDENNVLFGLGVYTQDVDGDTASSTLSINVDDDTPVAHNDTDTVPGGGNSASGNVISGVGTTEGAANADSPGADGFGGIVGLSGSGSSDTNPAGGFTVTGTYGSLQMDANGNYTYTRADGTPGNVSDVFTYTYVDGDGDTVSATLTIDIIDNAPSLGTPATVLLDDDALAGGNPGGVGDDPDSQNASGVLAGSGGDGALTYHFSGTNTLPSGFTTNLVDASHLQVLQGGTVVLTITLNTATGAYSVVQNAPIDHPAGLDENNVLFGVGVYVSDVDGDTASSTLTINVDDDTPTVSSNATVQLDDDALAGGNPGGTGDDPNAVNVSGTLAHSYGADGAGSMAYLTTGAPAGFSYSLQPNGDLWVMQGATHVLTLTINATTGAYTVAQVAPIDHAAGLDENNQIFTINYSVSDHDGDSAIGSLTINVDDDTPLANSDVDNIAAGGSSATGNVIDGTGTVGGTANADHPGADGFGGIVGLAGSGGSDTNPAGGFTVTGTYGSLQMDADGNYTYTRNPGTPGGVADVFSYIYQDGDGDTVAATLTINIADALPQLATPAAVLLDDDALAGGNPGGTGDDVDSQGTPGNLAGSGGDGPLTYHFSGTSTLPAGFTTNLVDASHLQILQGGTVVLTITLNTSTGAYSVVQNAAIDHPAGLNENNLGFLVGVYTQDVDGDTASASLSINVDDDTPLANNDSDLIASGGNSATGNVITGVGTTQGTGNADHPGADGFGGIVGLAGSGGSDTNPAGGFDVVGSHGTLHMDADGTYTYTRTDGAPGNVSDVFTYIYQDGDGDTVAATLTINIEDAAPQLATPAPVLLDDDALAGGNPGGTGDDVDSQGTPGNLAGSGGDGALTYHFGGANTLPAGFTTNLVDASHLQILQGGTVVLTITLNTATGAYSVVQNHAIDHPTGSDENNVAFSLGVYVQDTDGDTASSSLSINVDDDTPTVSSNATVQLDDDALANGNPGGTGDDANAVNTSGTLAHSYGADGAGSIAYLTTNAPIGFTYSLQPNGDLWVSQGGTHVLTLTVNASTGAYTVTQVAPINHAAGGDENNQVFVINYVVTDHDGDTATGSLTVNVDDDTPTATAVQLTGTVDEDGLPGGIAGGTGDVPGEAVTASGNVSSLFNPGADTPLVYQLVSASSLTALGLTSHGVALTYNVGVNLGVYTLTASAGGTTVFTFTLDSTTGAYLFTLSAPLDHPAGQNENDLSINLSSILQVSDHDGDTVAAGSNALVITIDDDSPTLGTIQSQTASNDPNQTPAVGTLHFAAGADGVSSTMTITSSTSATSGGYHLVTNQVGNVLTAYTDVNGNGVYDAGTDATAVYTITVDPTAGSSGQYTFNLLTALDPTITPFNVASDGAFGVGPSSSVIVTNGNTGDNVVFVTGWSPNGGFTAGEITAWEGGANPDLTQTSNVNGSTQGWGLANNNFDAGEFLRFDFGALNDYDGAGSYSPPGGTGDMAHISYADFTFFNFTGSEKIIFVAHYSDGSTSNIEILGSQGLSHYQINAPAGLEIDWIDVYQSSGSIKLNLGTIGIITQDINQNITNTVILTDGDGDSVSGGFTVNIHDGNTPATPALMAPLSTSKLNGQSITSDSLNTGIMAGTAAAVGLAAMPLAAQPVHGNSDGHALQIAAGNDFAVHAQLNQQVDVAETARGLVGLNDNPFAAVQADSDLPSVTPHFQADSNEHLLTAFGMGSSAQPSALLAPTDLPGLSANAAPIAMTAPVVAMPSPEALVAAGLEGGHGLPGGKIGNLVAEVLGGAGAPPTVDHLLQGLPAGGQGIGVAVGVGPAASPVGDAVQGWDMGQHGGFTPHADMLMKMDALVLHHDAVQPAVNG